MKRQAKWVLGFWALSAGLAYGQSSVTLYGVIDTGIDYVSNSGGKSQWSVVDGTLSGIYGSRWGLMGSEDLGGGRSVAFKLENGFNSANGQRFQGGRQFGDKRTSSCATGHLARSPSAGNTTRSWTSCNL